MPVTFEPPDVVKRVLELHYKHGLGYRRIADVLGLSSHNVAWRICRNYERGLIALNGDGSVRFNQKPIGIIKMQAEGLWNHRTKQPVSASPSRNNGRPKRLICEDEDAGFKLTNGQKGETAHTTLDMFDFLPLPPPFSLGTIKRIFKALK
jgi:predicted transcriptional regulator